MVNIYFEEDENEIGNFFVMYSIGNAVGYLKRKEYEGIYFDYYFDTFYHHHELYKDDLIAIAEKLKELNS